MPKFITNNKDVSTVIEKLNTHYDKNQQLGHSLSLAIKLSRSWQILGRLPRPSAAAAAAEDLEDAELDDDELELELEDEPQSPSSMIIRVGAPPSTPDAELEELLDDDDPELIQLPFVS